MIIIINKILIKGGFRGGRGGGGFRGDRDGGYGGGHDQGSY